MGLNEVAGASESKPNRRRHDVGVPRSTGRF